MQAIGPADPHHRITVYGAVVGNGEDLERGHPATGA